VNVTDTSTTVTTTMVDDPEDEYSDSVMVALLPMTTSWCNIALPHMTLVYAGEIKDLKQTDYNALAKDVASIAMLASPVTLQVLGVAQFGDGVEKVDALNLRSNSALLAMRNMVEQWNASNYPFNPHCTIGPVGSLKGMCPPYLAFDRIAVCWGSDLLTFWLNQGSY
jgi:2'-5' RNA ligase